MNDLGLSLQCQPIATHQQLGGGHCQQNEAWLPCIEEFKYLIYLRNTVRVDIFCFCRYCSYVKSSSPKDMDISLCHNKVSLHGCKLTAWRCVCAGRKHCLQKGIIHPTKTSNAIQQCFMILKLLLFHDYEIITLRHDVSKQFTLMSAYTA